MGADLQLAAVCSVMLIISLHATVVLTAGQHAISTSFCSPSDSQALSSFAASLHTFLFRSSSDLFDSSVDAHSLNKLWNSTRNPDCCSWAGVGCSSWQEAPPPPPVNGSANINAVPVRRVTTLSLSIWNHSVSSTAIRLELLFCNLPFLSNLSLINLNNVQPPPVSSQFADCLVKQLPWLKHLRLFNLPFKGRLPNFQAPLLQSLYLRACSFSGPLPTFNTPLLQKLYLPDNQLSSSLDQFTLLSNLTALTVLELSHNSISGPIPSSISRLHDLHILDLSYNSLSGPLPIHSLCELSHLEGLYLSDNSVSTAKIAAHPQHCAQLTTLELASNHITGPFPHWISHFPSLETLDLSFNTFSSSVNGTRLPAWIFRFPKLRELWLSSLGLQSEDVLCSTRVSMLNKTLEWLDVSGNNITGSDLLECFARHSFEQVSGVVLDENPLSISLSESIQLLPVTKLRACNLTGSLSNKRIFEGLIILDLSQNHLVGKIPTNFTERITSLNLSDNYLTGFDSYDDIFQSLSYIDLSHNLLAGDVSTVLQTLGFAINNSTADAWRYLRLSYNELGGQIPSFLPAGWNVFKFLSSLLLDHNILTGQIPASIITENLLHLDLSFNELEGNLKNLFGHSLQQISPSNLLVLDLAHNRISGSIPSFLGTFTPALCIIDISHNNLTGNIPHDLHLPSFQNEGSIRDRMFNAFPLFEGFYLVGFSIKKVYGRFALFFLAVDVFPLADLNFPISIVLKGVERSLQYARMAFKFLDLSENYLQGSIPSEIGNLCALLHLNLSHNTLSGHIPETVGKLAMLETLDLSFNRLQGIIPTSLSDLSKLEVFNVSYNEELQGPVPMGSQLTNNESYRGDQLLCGVPVLQRPCTDQPLELNVSNNENTENTLKSWINEWISVPGLLLGVVVGFCTTLWIRHGTPLIPLLMRNYMHAS